MAPVKVFSPNRGKKAPAVQLRRASTPASRGTPPSKYQAVAQAAVSKKRK